MWLNESMIWDLIIGFVLLFVLVISSGTATHILEKLSKKMKANRFFLATVLIGFSISLPELAIGVAAALRGQPQIALGNIMGANLVNLSWIIGGAAMVMGTIPVIGDFWKRELWVTFAMAVLPLFLMMDERLTRLEGCLLVIAYLFYVYGLVKGKHVLLKQAKMVGRKASKDGLVMSGNLRHELLLLIVSLLVLAVSAWGIINLTISMSASLNVNLYWVGLLLISFVTTLPELALSLFFVEKKKISLVLADILGGVVVNSTLILGLVVIISPISYKDTMPKAVAGILLLITLGLFWVFTKSKHKLERWEGIVLVGIYVMFVGLQFLLV